MMHLVLVIAVVFVFAASCLLTFGLCRAATRPVFCFVHSLWSRIIQIVE